MAASQYPTLNGCCRAPHMQLGDIPKKCENYIKSLNDEDWDFSAFAHVCYPACIYRETGAMVNDVIQMDIVREFLNKHVMQKDQELVPHIVKAFESCLKSIQQHLDSLGLDKYAVLSAGCSPYASMVYGCVNAETFLNCPPNFWANDEHEVHSCNTARDFARQCNPLPHVPLPRT